MKKLNIEVEAVVSVPVQVKLALLVKADDDANVGNVIKQFAKGHRQTRKSEIEDVTVEAAVIQGDLDADEPLMAHIANLLNEGGKITVLESKVTDSR